jgi:DNA-binding MurR/RpiR family transcriptional regulator
MKSQPQSSFLSRLREHLGAMHPTERRLAEFMLDFPGDLASYSASELAKLSGVSNATVTRMVRRLGYATFESARRHVREEKNSGSPLFLAGRAVESPGKQMEAHLLQGVANLRWTFTHVEESTLQAIAKKIVGARRVWITGFRSSHSLANYLRMQLFQIKESSELFPSPGASFGEYVASFSSADLLIVFGLRRRPARLRLILQQLVDTGASVLYITDNKVARQSAVTWHVQCACDSTEPLDNHVAVIGICHALVNETIALAGHAGRKRLASIEARHDALGEF